MPTTDLASGVTTLCKYAFDQETVQRGLDYHAQGRVLSSNALLHKDNLHIHATVRGRQPQPYLVEARLFRTKGGSGTVRIEAICTCPLGFNCKHAAAAIADIFGKDGMRLFSTHTQRVTLEAPETTVELPPQPVPGPFSGWLNSLRAVPRPAAPAPPQKTILYRLDISDYRGLEVHIMQCSRLKSGALGKASPWRSQQIDADSPYPPDDLAILRELAGMSYKSESYALNGAFGARMLQRLIATGKCHWKTVHHDTPLKPGPVRTAALDWAITPDGAQAPTIALQPPADTVLALETPLYIDSTTGECGGIAAPHSPEVIKRWLAAPPVEPLESRAVAAQVRTLGLPAPREIAVVERRHVRPIPILHLLHVPLRQPLYNYHRRETNVTALDLVRLEFDYAGLRIYAFDGQDAVETFRQDRVESIVRNAALEKAAHQELTRTGLAGLYDFYNYGIPDEYQDDATFETPEEWMTFMNDVVPKLRQHGWRIEIDPGFRYQFAAVQDWYSQTTTDATVNDWFSFELGILVDGQRHNLLPMIRGVLDELQKLQAQAQLPESIDLKLPDGRFVQLPAQRVLDIGKILAELYDPAALVAGRLQVSRLRAAELVDLPGLGQWKGDEELRTLARRLASYQGIARLQPPAGLSAILRPYQLDGLSWLQFLREYSFGGILADDMGLGKTVQVLAHLVLEKESGRANLPSLVVAPTSLMANWRAETQRFAPGLRVHVSHGGDRKEHFERLADFDLIVTSYSLLPRDEDILKGQPFHLLILDEAQYVKNPNTKWADVARSLSARHRLCMTGTPMENHLGELWSLMTFLSPGYLGNQKQFSRVYRGPIEKAGDHDRRKSLAQRVRPFILRRRKEEVALDLPPKTEITRTVELDGPQRDLYETVRLAMHQRVQDEIAKRGMDRSHIIILDALLKLRQICCDPRLVKLDSARKVKESAKLELLLDLLPKMIEEGRHVLLFSQFTSMLDLIEPETSKRGIPFVRLDGATADRETPVRRFQAGEVPLFLISLKAGGTGLNLTAADTVIHYDPWWNPAVEQQATDRAHRIGQDKPVFVYKLVTQGTVEEKIVAMQDRKRELVAGLLDDGAQQNLQLSKEDLDHLFDPIG